MNRFNKDEESSGEEEEVILLEDDFESNITQEELLGYAQFLGFDIENDVEYLPIANEALKKPLPEGWRRAYLKNSNRMCYIDLTNQQFYLYSPVDEEAINAYQQAKKLKEKKSTVVPKTKLLPIGESNQEKNKTKKLTKEGILNSVHDNYNKDSNFIKKNDHQRESKLNENIYNKNKEKTSKEQNGKRNNNLARKYIEDLEGLDQFNIPSPELKREEKEDKHEIEKRKYYNDAIQKLKNFKQELIKEKKKKEEELEQKEKKLKKNNEDINKKKLDNQVNEFEDEIKKRIEEFESKIIEENTKLEQEIITINEKMKKHKIEELENKITSLNEEKTKINLEIDCLKKEKPNEEESENGAYIQFYEQAKYLLEEKFQIELKNLERKFINQEKEIEKNQDVDYINEYNNNKAININTSILSEKVKEIVNEYMKALDQEFEINSNALKLEIEEKIEKELKILKENLDIEENIRKAEFDKEGEIIKNLFLKDIYINKDTNKNIIEKSLRITDNFDSLVENIEELKIKMKENIDAFSDDLLSKLSQGSTSRDSLVHSKNFEDYLIGINDEKLLSFHKKKNKLDIVEIEYKDKSILFEYFIDVGKELIKILRINSENTNLNILDDNLSKGNISQQILSLYKEKVKQYKFQSEKIKSTQLYNINSFIKPALFTNTCQRPFSVRSCFEERIMDIPYKSSKSNSRFNEILLPYAFSPEGNNRKINNMYKSPGNNLTSSFRDSVYKDLEHDIENIVLKENGLNTFNLSKDLNFRKKLRFEDILKRVSKDNLFLYKKIEIFINDTSKKIELESNEIETDRVQVF